ncbi:putative SERF-like protein [Senna tora]|uniref:Putative SERF-like protein n=1 Tax=Senna tora TaxID=362788 RepID=A0A835CMG2_9FABA|nr:putative SERF-like protein [Senna tora]
MTIHAVVESHFCQRGNQRERDRERAQARASSKTKQPKNDGLTPEQRRERDAKALQEKTARKAAQAAGGNKAGGGGKK